MFPCLALLLSCGNKIMLVGYARVSTADQNPQLQLDALIAAGCGKVFVEKASGAKINRAELTAALEYMRPGDTLTVWKLDRLARSMKQLITTVEDLKDRGIGFRSLTEAIDTTNAAGAAQPGLGTCALPERAQKAGRFMIRWRRCHHEAG